MGIVINGVETDVEPEHLYTLIEVDNPTADIARALLEIAEGNYPPPEEKS